MSEAARQPEDAAGPEAVRAARRALGQFFTPPDLVAHLLDVCGADTLPEGARVLEPACGDGAFLVGLVERLGARAAGLRLRACEVDPEAAEAARGRLAAALAAHAGLTEAAARARAEQVVRLGDFLEQPAPGGFDLVLGNPPYLEAKRMPRDMKARLRAAHPAWTRGAFDLFVPFVGRAAEALAPGGRLAFVLPNKVCIAAYARPLRQALLDGVALESLTDLWDTRAFSSAAVYPVVLTARRRLAPTGAGEGGRPEPAADVATWRGHRQGEGLAFHRTGRLPRRTYREAPDQVFFTLPDEAEERDELARLLDPPARLADYLDVRWTISFHAAGLRDRYLFPERPASPHARKLLGAGRYEGNADVQRYRLDWRGWWIDYDQERARADGNPLPDPAIFEAPKIVICQNALRLRAAIDREGHALKDTFFAARPTARCLEEGVPLEALLGVLSSEVLHRFYRALFGMTRVNGGYLHYLGSYLRHLPVPDVDALRDPALLEAVRACEAAAAAGPPDAASVEARLAEPAARVEVLVRQAFGLAAG